MHLRNIGKKYVAEQRKIRLWNGLFWLLSVTYWFFFYFLYFVLWHNFNSVYSESISCVFPYRKCYTLEKRNYIIRAFGDHNTYFVFNMYMYYGTETHEGMKFSHIMSFLKYWCFRCDFTQWCRFGNRVSKQLLSKQSSIIYIAKWLAAVFRLHIGKPHSKHFGNVSQKLFEKESIALLYGTWK